MTPTPTTTFTRLAPSVAAGFAAAVAAAAAAMVALEPLTLAVMSRLCHGTISVNASVAEHGVQSRLRRVPNKREALQKTTSSYH